MKNNKDITVYVAMSGGVDSSVAAGLIKEAGYNTVGVTMDFNIMRNDCKASCCGIDGIADAQRAQAFASTLGKPEDRTR